MLAIIRERRDQQDSAFTLCVSCPNQRHRSSFKFKPTNQPISPLCLTSSIGLRDGDTARILRQNL